MTLSVGVKPDQLEFNLYDGDPFTTVLTPDDGAPWPTAAVVEFRFPGADPVVTWTATIDGANATWDESAGTVSARSTGEVVEYRVNGVTEAVGVVTMRGRS